MPPAAYTPGEFRFTALAARWSGWFLARQFNFAVGTSRGAMTQAFIQRLLANGHATVSVHANNTCLYHLSSRSLYALLEQENNRNRRKRPAHQVRTRLMCLDFVLEHGFPTLLDTEEKKVAHFQELGIPTEVLPHRLYRGKDGAQTVRYFLEKFPIWTGPAGHTAFAFITGDSPSRSLFESFLQEHELLFVRLRRFEIIFVSSRQELIDRGEAVFDAFFHYRAKAQELSEVFRLRALYDAGRGAELQMEELRVLQAGLLRYRSERFDALYQNWMLERERAGAGLQATFTGVRLEHRYDIFGDLNYGRE